MNKQEAKQPHNEWIFSPLTAYCIFEDNGKKYKATIKKAELRLLSTKEAVLKYSSDCIDNAEEIL